MEKTVKGIGKDSIKANNMIAILSCIQKNAPVSRRDIAKLVRLTPSTVTLLVNEMIACGLLREGDEVDEGVRAGRRAQQLEFDPAFGYILGVSIEPAHIALAVVRMAGGNLGRVEAVGQRVIENIYQPAKLVPALLNEATAFLASLAPQGRFCAIGISITGHVNPDNGVSVNSYGVLPAGTPVAALFEERFGVPVFLDNNVRGIALAEMGLRLESAPVNGLFLKQDPGFGCTVLLDGEVYEGANDSSGEIGHTRVLRGGKQCSCGKTGCLSTVVSTSALIEAAGAVLSPSATPALWAACGGRVQDIDVPMLSQCAAAGDQAVAFILDEAARLMSSVIETSLLLMDGNCIITFGPLFAHDWFFEKLRDYLQESFAAFRAIQLKRSRLSDADRWKGAVYIAVRKYMRVIGAEIAGAPEHNS